MKCKHVQQRLVDYSESLVDRKTRLQIEEHLRNCPECAQELKDFEETIHLLQVVPIQEPPEAFWADFTSDVMRKIESTNTTAPAGVTLFSFPSFRVAAVAAAALFLLVGSLLAYSSGAFRKVLPSFSAPSKQLHVTSLEQSSQEPGASIVDEMLPEGLILDIIESDLALLDRDTTVAFSMGDDSDIVHLLIESLSEEEKELLLEELHQMKE